MGVELRRRFGVDRGRLTAYEDERLTRGDAADHSAILAAEIERPRSGPMRDIVSTIQPEQDEIVRSDLATSICVQGAPGTGKTAVGLHRAAWLLYSFRSQLDRSGVLVVGPNRAFLDHIGAVLPSLGEVRVRHATIDTLLEHGRVRPRTPPTWRSSRATPASPRCSAARCGRTSAEPRRRSSSRAVPAAGGCRPHEIRDEVDALVARGVRYSAARDLLPQRLAHHVLLQMERSGDSPDDRVQDAIARSAPGHRLVRGLWPGLDPAGVLFGLFSDAVTLADAADGILTAEEQRMLLWDKPPRTKGAARWTRADKALLDEVADLLDRTPSLGHVVLDEAQDLSPMQLRAVGRRASTGSLTVLGDIAQGTTPWATESWGTRWATSAARPRARRPRPRVPRARPRHRVRRPPAPSHGAGARGAAVGARQPGPSPSCPSTRTGARRRSRMPCAAVAEPGSVGVIARMPTSPVWAPPSPPPACRTAGSTPTTATTRTARSSWCRRASPRAWSSTGSSSSSRPRS